MKLIRRQKIWLALVLAINAALWAVPSDVVELIARNRHVLLGRYSRGHLSLNLIVLVCSFISFYVDWSTGAAYKRRWFQVIAVLLFLVPSVTVLDYVLRSPERGHYIKDTLAYHHPPNGQYTATFIDQPEALRTYPDAPPGYPAIERSMRTDARGFRNAMAVEQCEVLVLGDSFAEGSGVSDEHVWPVLLAERTGLGVYNLGMSGYDPANYLASLTEVGLALRPHYVLCMIYEGNDFRRVVVEAEDRRPSAARRVQIYFKQSPLITAMDRMLIETFGPLRAHAAVAGIDVLDWLPLAIPEGPAAKHYAFDPKQLRDGYQSAERFSRGKKWLSTRRLIGRMHDACVEAGARFVLVYAPTKSHVTMPLVGDRLPPEKVRAFSSMALGSDLPPGPAFVSTLLDRIGVREAVVRAWCAEEGIEFVSTTDALAAAVLAGRQVYFTYDQHWTPPGHEVVAGLLGHRIQLLLRSTSICW